MKKLFFFAIAVLGMTAACQKQGTEGSEIDDNSPVAVQFNVSAPTLTVTKTKAPVEDWNKETVFVYGYKKGADFSNTSDPDIFLIDGVSGTISTGNPASIAFDNSYYYKGTNVYNFNAYYIDDAQAENAVKNAASITKVITITGTQDVMVATTTPKDDIPEGKESEVNESRIYSAYAARRGVHPTLNFQHMLTRFNFIIKKGESTNTDTRKVYVNSIEVKSPNSLTLTVAPTPSITTAQTSTNYASLNVEFPSGAKRIEPGDDVATDAGNIMIYPDLAEITINLGLTDDDGTYTETMPITLKASDVIKDGSNANITKFAASAQYDIEITVYDLEKVTISATLGVWEDGGDMAYDPDEYWPE